MKEIIFKAVSMAHNLLDNAKQERERARRISEFWAGHDARYLRECSYYKNERLKPEETIKAEITDIFLSGRCGRDLQFVLEEYLMFGLDRADARVEEYVFTREFAKLQAKGQPPFAGILDNKLFTLVYLSARGIPVSRIIGTVDNACVFSSLDGLMVMPFIDWLETRAKYPVFCKLPDGMQGTSCFVLARDGERWMANGKPLSRQELNARAPQLQVEEMIQQHDAMSAIYPHSVNTCRLVTVSTRGKVILFSGRALFGSNGARVSNCHSGGLLVPFDENGQLGCHGMKELPWGGGLFEKHPDTGVAFAGRQIPFFKEAIDLVIKAHLTMPSIGSIGWDVAITPTGPVIIEGNRRWAFPDHQYMTGGLRKKVLELFS